MAVIILVNTLELDKHMKVTLGFVLVSGAMLYSVALFSQTQSELNHSAREEFAAADEQLHIVYQKLFNALDSAGQEKLVSSQKAWTAYRDAEAAFEEDQVRGGTAAPTVLDAAQAELTRERIRQLQRLLPNNS
jgi:uncharacterized protein YecT (DUF1311 family)